MQYSGFAYESMVDETNADKVRVLGICSFCGTQNKYTASYKLASPVSCFNCGKTTLFPPIQNLQKGEPISQTNTIPNNIPKTEQKKQYIPKTKEKLKETDYYDILEVKADSTSSDIKKSYYKLARTWHPDKNPDNPEAEIKFKQIAEAYQVLSDPEQREKYDKYGKDGVSGDFMDPHELFSMFFGGGKFEHLVGEVMASMGDSETPREDQEAKLKLRVSKLVATYLEILQPFMNCRREEFEENIQKQIEDLKGESFGIEIFHMIGYVFSNKANQMLGGIIGFAESFFEKGHILGSSISAIKAAVDISKEGERLQNNTELNEEERNLKESKLQEDSKGALLKVGRIEIEMVLRKVCEALLKDPSESREIRKRRAEGMLILGKLFSNAKL